MLQFATVETAVPSSTRPEIAAEPYSVMVASGREWEHEIDEQRIASSRTAGSFKLPNPATVRRRTDPDDSFCLVIRQGAVLAATVRLAYVHERTAAGAVLQGPVPLDGDDSQRQETCAYYRSLLTRYQSQGATAFNPLTGKTELLRDQAATQALQQARFAVSLYCPR